MSRGNGVEFVKKVGIVSGAVIAAGTIVSFVYGFATKPIMDAIADEARSRIAADERLADRLLDLSRDRIALLSILEHPPGSRARAEEIRTLRLEWQKEPRR